jgi:hypothetical protein
MLPETRVPGAETNTDSYYEFTDFRAKKYIGIVGSLPKECCV